MKRTIRELRKKLSLDRYGGLYLDQDNQTVHLNIIDTTDIDLVRTYDDVVTHKVKYSLDELNRITAALE